MTRRDVRDTSDAAIRKLIRHHLASSPTVRAAQVLSGRNGLSGQAQRVRATLEAMVAEGELATVPLGYGSAVYFERGFALLVGVYLRLHAVISAADLHRLIAATKDEATGRTEGILAQVALTQDSFLQLTERIAAVQERLSDAHVRREVVAALADLVAEVEAESVAATEGAEDE